MCVIAIDYVCIFIEYMHFICTVSLGTMKGAFKIKCVIYYYNMGPVVVSSSDDLLRLSMNQAA